MKDSDFYKLIIGDSLFVNDSFILTKEEVHLLEVINRLRLLGDYLRYSHYIPLESGYNIRDVIRSPAPPTTKKKPKK